MIQGEQGSAKSTFARVLRELIDPGVAGLRTPPNDERDLVIAATNSYLLAFDNVSHVKYDLSDALCRLATGTGLGTRQLYTNSDEQLFEICRPAMLNGIPELATRSALRDRSIVLVLPPIPDDQRRDEDTFWQEFNEAKALILGAICDALSSALRESPHTKLSALPRMADFVRWVTAAESTLGWPKGSFLASYRASRDESAVLSVEHDVVARAVWEAASEATGLEETPAGMLELLRTKVGEDVARSREWPLTARALTDRLKRVAPDLRRIGYEIKFGRGHERWIRVHVHPEAQPPLPKRELPM
jgi:putative DNA primase/helicase